MSQLSFKWVMGTALLVGNAMWVTAWAEKTHCVSSSPSRVAEKCLTWPEHALPSCFPKSVPIYPHMAITLSQGTPFASAYLVQGVADGGIQTVWRFYRHEAYDNGWRNNGVEQDAANDTVKASLRRKAFIFRLSLTPNAASTNVTIETCRIASNP